MDRTKYLSRAAAARALGVKASTVDRLATKHNIRTFQVPGHCRKWFDRRDVEALLAAAVGMEARVEVERLLAAADLAGSVVNS